MKIDGELRSIFVADVLETEVFHHVAGTYDGSVMRLYLDGVDVGNLAVSGTVATGDGVNLSSQWDPMDGLIDEVGIYNRALSVDEIQAIYNAGSAGKFKPPVASFTYSPSAPGVGETVNFDASASSDPDGTITSYAWHFGDDNSGTGVSTSHAYEAAGTYTVTLTVTDDNGLTDTATEDVTVIPPDGHPVASFDFSPTEPEKDETVSFNASGSTDSDGTIVNYAWDFGDGSSGTGKTTTHAYGAAGTYTVTLTVTDNDDLTGAHEEDITVIGIDVMKPYADARTSDHTVEVGTTVTCDASGCSDNVGVVSYEWDFGDGTTGTGVIATHTYTEEGTYTVTLTVRDAAENSDTDTLKITVEEPAVPSPLWVLALVIGVIAGCTAVLVYVKKRKPKEEVMKPPEPIITAEPTEIPAPAKKIEEEVLKPPEEIPPQKVKEFPKLSAKCSDTVALLNSFIEDPSPINDRKAWKSFKEFITITEQIEDEYAELIEIRNKLAILRRKRKEYRSAGLDDLADKTEGLIQRNYGDSIRIIKEIQEKLPQLGN
jgi:PKD repeat protein